MTGNGVLHAAGVSGGGGAAEIAGSEGARERLLERRRELEALGRAIEHSRRGDGRLVVVEGAPGIGKTRLVAEAVDSARELGMMALRASAVPDETNVAYGVIRQLFEPVVRDERLAESLLRGRAAGASGAFDAESRDGDPGGERTVRTIHGLYWLAINLAEHRPLVLAVDDAQWSDAPSLRAISYLARRLGGLRILVLIARRRGGLVDPAGEEALARTLDAEVLRPVALSEEATGLLVRDAVGGGADEAFCAACHRASGGNPLLLQELVRTLAAQGVDPTSQRVEALTEVGPGAVAGTVRARLAELPAAATELVEAAAVLGDRTPLRRAAELAGLDADAADEAVRELRRIEILDPGPEIAFVHPLVRDALRDGIDPNAAERAHAKAAEALRRDGAADAAIARQLLHVSPAAEQSRLAPLRSAARESLSAGDSVAAAAYLRRALAEPPPAEERPAVLLELASAEEQFDGKTATGRLEEAVGLVSDPVERATVSVRLASMLPSAKPEDALRVGLEAAAELGDAEPELRRRLLGIAATGSAIRSPAAGIPGERLEAIRAETDEGGEGARLIAAALGYRDAWCNVPLDEWLPAAERAFAGDWVAALEVTGGPMVLGLIALLAADSPVAERAIEDWDRRGRKGEFQLHSGARLMRAHLHLARGELTDAAREADEALELMEAWGMRGAALAYAASALAEAAIEVGDIERARQAVARAGGRDSEAGAVGIHGLLAARARLRAASGEWEVALAETLELGRRFEDLGGRCPALLPWRSRAVLILDSLGRDGDRAAELAAEELELAREWGGARAVGRALLAAARVAEGGNQALAEEAVETLGEVEAPLEQTRAGLVLGELRIAAGDPVPAREPLREALELAIRCAAAPLEKRARELLTAAGARPRRAAVSGPAALTAAERRVAALAAAGGTNREIAEQLYLTPSTVESHLTRVYRKLAIDSRSRLAAALDDAPAP